MGNAGKIFHQTPGQETWGGGDFRIRKKDPFIQVKNSEIDLRVEMKKLLYGGKGSTGKGFQVILRQTIKGVRGRAWNRDSGIYDEAIHNDPNIAKQAWPQRDVIITMTKTKFVGLEYQTPVGEMDYTSGKFYMEYNVDIDKDDEIIEVLVDDLGKIVSPVKYISKYSVKDIEYYHGNSGRVEFIRAIGAKTR